MTAYTLHRTLRVLMHIARQINESFALTALHELNVKERKTRVGKNKTLHVKSMNRLYYDGERNHWHKLTFT